MNISPKITPVLDPGFVPAVLWNRAYQQKVASTPGSRDIAVALTRNDGLVFVWNTKVLPAGAEFDADNHTYIERAIKFFLWMKGGSDIIIGGAPDIAEMLAKDYSKDGARNFDWDFIGDKIYDKFINVTSVALADVPAAKDAAQSLGRHLNGNRIGFDLGGSDRKAAAVVNGEVIFSEEIKWDPYFEADWHYHLDGIRDTLNRAIAALTERGLKLDAIGGSAAGVYVNNQVRTASLFRGVMNRDYTDYVANVRPMFLNLAKEYGVPFELVNDGEVTALAGSMSLNSNSVLGISMGTSLAAGYVDEHGSIKPWLNELAFAPIDYRANGPVDEWSKDEGCGVQYFSQQGVARLAKVAGLDFGDMKFPEQLEEVQKLMAEGDERAEKIYSTIGVCFGYAIASYAEYYDIKKLLILGRVTSGQGGQLIIKKAEEVLAAEFPELAAKIEITTPDEKMKRHGQAVAAASLPELA